MFISKLLIAGEPIRIWTNSKGDKMEASLIRFKKDKIEIKRIDGRIFTLAPTIFSDEDQNYVKEAQKRTDSSGEFWSKEKAIYELTRQKWMVGAVGSPSARYQNFKKEKIDIDGDGKIDGYKLWQQSKNSGFAISLPIRAWEVRENGTLFVKFIYNGSMKKGEYKYDFQSGYYNKAKKGSNYGVEFYRPIEK